MLDRLFPSLYGARVRRGSASVAIGDLMVNAEALRIRTMGPQSGLDSRSVTKDRRLAAGLDAGWAVGPDDRVSLGVAASQSRIAEPAVLAGRPRLGGSTLAADIGWTHGTRWHANVGWQRNAGSTRVPGSERLVQIAQGAPLHEQGFRMALAYAPMSAATGYGATFGIEGKAMRLGGDDAALLGSGARQDAGAMAFLRVRP